MEQEVGQMLRTWWDYWKRYRVTDANRVHHVATVTPITCSCTFYRQQLLSCRHMVKCWQEGMIPLDQLVFKGWTKERCNILQPGRQYVAVVRQPAPTFRRIRATVTRLTEFITACGDQQAVQRLRLLESTVQNWDDGVDVQLHPSHDVLETTAAAGDDQSEQADDAVLPTAGYPSRDVFETTPAVGDNQSQDTTETAQLPDSSVQRAEGVTLKRVRGRGNVRQKKTVTFSKRPAEKENAQCHYRLDENASVVCDACFTWYHLSCCGLKPSFPASRSARSASCMTGHNGLTKTAVMGVPPLDTLPQTETDNIDFLNNSAADIFRDQLAKTTPVFTIL